MNTILEHDNVTYGVYAGCLEVLLVVALFGLSSYIGEDYPLFLSFLVISLPIVLLGMFMKTTMVKSLCEKKDLTGYELFSSGYSTGIVATFVFSGILYLSYIFSLLLNLDVDNFLIEFYSVTYNTVVTIGIGVIISLLISYFLYYTISHLATISYPSTYRRLPGKSSKKSKSKKTSAKKK